MMGKVMVGALVAVLVAILLAASLDPTPDHEGFEYIPVVWRYLEIL
jgi:hypothetical protein